MLEKVSRQEKGVSITGCTLQSLELFVNGTDSSPVLILQVSSAAREQLIFKSTVWDSNETFGNHRGLVQVCGSLTIETIVKERASCGVSVPRFTVITIPGNCGVFTLGQDHQPVLYLSSPHDPTRQADDLSSPFLRSSR